MSDERLREAERRWRETGAVDDEARYLLERVRVGDLTRERLELAAYCGHEGARQAVALEKPGSSLWAMLERLSSTLPRAAMIQAMIEVAHVALTSPVGVEPTVRDRCLQLVDRARRGIDVRTGFVVDPDLELAVDAFYEASDPQSAAFVSESVASGPIYFALQRVDDEFVLRNFAARLEDAGVSADRFGLAVARALGVLASASAH